MFPCGCPDRVCIHPGSSICEKDKTITMENDMAGYPKVVTLTKTVPVADRETLRVWLNQQLQEYLKSARDGGVNKSTAGTKALDLIEAAGFRLTLPTGKR